MIIEKETFIKNGSQEIIYFELNDSNFTYRWQDDIDNIKTTTSTIVLIYTLKI